MVAQQPPALPAGASVAWPMAVVRERQNGSILGFAMPRIDDAKSVFGIANTWERWQSAPGVNWHFQHEVARNLSQAVASVHKHGAVIGDLNCRNVLVTKRRTVVLIDVDSWQICDTQKPGQFFHCQVGMEEYTPAEISGLSGTLVRTEAQDCFALSVLVFQLLCFFHPYAVRSSSSADGASLGENIKQGHSVFSSMPTIQPPLNTVPLNILNPQLLSLFRRAFVDGHQCAARRPTAVEWVQALDVALDLLHSCRTDPSHFIGISDGVCFWCEAKEKRHTNYFPATSAAPHISALPDRFLDSLTRGDDRQVSLWVNRHSWLLNDPKCKAQAMAIATSLRRMALLHEWLELQSANPTEPWLLVDRWPSELTDTFFAASEHVNGQPVGLVVRDLATARQRVRHTLTALSLWSAIADIDERVACYPHNIINEIRNPPSPLPAAYPEMRELRARVQMAVDWWAEWIHLRDDLQKLEQLHEDGEDDIAIEMLDQLEKLWPGYGPLRVLRAGLHAGRPPWDTTALRDDIRMLFAKGHLRAARTKLALLHTASLPRLRRQLEDLLLQAERAASAATAALAVGDPSEATECFARAEKLCKDLPYDLMGRIQAESAEAKRRTNVAARRSHRAPAATTPRSSSGVPRRASPHPHTPSDLLALANREPMESPGGGDKQNRSVSPIRASELLGMHLRPAAKGRRLYFSITMWLISATALIAALLWGASAQQ
jgi:hypothetical protein